MTCQWCIHYRRRKGKVRCVSPDTDGEVIPGTDRCASRACFVPRKSCTTCKHRCDPEEKLDRMGDGACATWSLRDTETWGGYRKVPGWRKKFCSANKNQTKGKQR